MAASYSAEAVGHRGHDQIPLAAVGRRPRPVELMRYPGADRLDEKPHRLAGDPRESLDAKHVSQSICSVTLRYGILLQAVEVVNPAQGITTLIFAIIPPSS
jgi:hypothetical protein